MKRNKLKIIIGVMALSVTGLIALQIFWLNNLIKIENERFERTVNSDMQNVSEKIEKNEAAKIVLKNITGGKGNVLFYAKNDSTFRVSTHSKVSPFKIIRIDSSKSGNEIGVRVSAIDTGRGKNKVEVFENHVVSSPNAKGYSWNTKTDTLVIKQNKLVQNVVTELFSDNTTKKIEDRISVKLIDSLLNNELVNSGINTDYYFAVNELKNNKLTLIKPGTDTTLIRSSNLRSMLFPAEMFFNPNQLIIYFPNKSTYLFTSVAGMLVLSISLILIITFVFYKTVRMFIQQKKITEIKNDLINNITHEFKTPISTISAACEAINEPKLTKDLAGANKYSKIIWEENERLRLMVENLLNTAAFEKDSYQLEKTETSLDEVIYSASDKFKEKLNQKNGKILLEGFPTGISINADKFHIINIIGNLIDNAIKYNEREPEITIRVEKENQQINMYIADNGIGIAKENFNKIFETFYRVSTGDIHNVRGNGIGLSYAKKIIAEHGGIISVFSSQIGKGSIFQITLPVSDSQTNNKPSN